MTDSAHHAYDEVLYPSYPFAQTHPDRLATLGTLFGMQPAPVEQCRVLELGCGDGANLIPMAVGTPGSEFVGIDIAARPLAKGQAIIEALGLKNISLRQGDVLDISRDFGQFDYIIAHGLYSWVPSTVQDKVLAICKENLAPNGIAFVSYNTYPGGHLRQMVRDMMLFHVQRITEPAQRVAQARALLKFVSEAQSDSDIYGTLLQEQHDRVSSLHEGSLYHDDLAEMNMPVYFYQFVEHATQHGLQYVAEADFFEMQDQGFSREVSATLNQLANSELIRKEQYADFLKCRKFRQTLLCHQDVRLDRTLRPERMAVFQVASPMSPVSVAPDLCSTTTEKFRGPTGTTLSTNQPLAKAALLCLSEVWPQSLHFNELRARARSRLGLDTVADEATQDALTLGDLLLKAYAANLVELHIHAPHFVLEVNERPIASPLARLQARTGTVVTTLRHTSAQAEDALGRCLLVLLDGTRNRAALLNDLTALIQSGAIAVVRKESDVPVKETHQIQEILADELEQNLAKLAKLALLVG